MANLVSAAWGEMFKEMQDRSSNPKYRYFKINSATYGQNPDYKSFAAAAKIEYKKEVTKLSSGKKISSVKDLEFFLNKKIQKEFESEVKFYNYLKTKTVASGNPNEKILLDNFNYLCSASPNGSNFRKIIRVLKETLAIMYQQNGQIGVGAKAFSELVRSSEVYNNLKNPIESFFSRYAILTSIGMKKSYDASVNKNFKDNLGNMLVDNLFLSDKFTTNLGDDTTKILQLNVTEGLGAVVSDFFGKDTVTKTQFKGTSIANLKTSFKNIIRQNMLGTSGLVGKTQKITTKIQGKEVTYNVSLDADKFKISDQNDKMILQVGYTIDNKFSIGNKFNGMELIMHFYTTLLAALPEGEGKKWFKRNGKGFLEDVFGFQKIPQNATPEDLKRVQGLRIYNNSGISGILGELGAAALKYAGFGEKVSMEGTSQVDGYQSHYDVSIETTINNLEKVGIQVKNKVTSGNTVNLYSGKKDLTLKSRLGLGKYLGEDMVSALQYFIVNQKAYESFDFNSAGLLSESYILNIYRQIIPTYVTQFLRYEGSDEKIVKNMFYMINGELVPSSIILYLFKKEYCQKEKALPLSISSVSPDIFSPVETTSERGGIPPERVKNLVNNNYLTKTKVQFRGLQVDIKKLLG